MIHHAQFNEFYCMCGCVCSQEMGLLYHLKSIHLPVHKLFMFLKHTHVPIDQIDMDTMPFMERPEILGTIE